MDHSPYPRKNSFSKVFLRVFLILLCGLVLFTALLPYLISSPWGKEKVVAMMNGRIPGKVKIENLSIGWFGPQIVEGLSLSDSQNASVFSLESLSTTSSLFSFLLHPTSIDSLTLKNLDATIIGDSEGNTNLVKALDKRCCDKGLEKGTPVAIILKNTNATINLKDNGPITLQLSGETEQNTHQGKFLLDAELRGITLQEVVDRNLADLLNSKPDAALKVDADITNFPVELLDEILSLRNPSLNGLLTKILGDELNLKIKQQPVSNGLSINIEANSSTLSASADILTDKEISLKTIISHSSKASNQNQPTKINLDISSPKKNLLKNISEISLKDLTINGEITGASFDILDEFIESSVLPSAIIGSNADLTFSLKQTENRALGAIQFKSEQLEIPRLTFWIDDKITLQKTAQVILKVNQHLLNQLFLKKSPQLQGPATAQLIINSFSAPLSNLPVALKMAYQLNLDAQLKVTSLRLANVSSIGAISLNDFSANLSADPKKRPELTASFSLQPDGPSILTDLLGKKTAVKSIASLGTGLDGKLVANSFNIQVVSDLIRLEMSGEMHQGNRIVLNSPTLLNYTLTEAGLQAMGIATDSYLFKSGVPLEMTLDASHIPLSFSDLTMLSLKGKLKVKDFQLMSKSQKKDSLTAIDNLSANWSVDAASKHIEIDFNGLTRLGKNQATGKISGEMTVSNWIYGGVINLEKAIININANADKLPTELLSALSGQKDLVPILGNAIDLGIKANASIGSTENGTISFDVNSQNLSGSIALTLGDVIQLSNNRPAEFTLKLTPQGYAALRRRINGSYPGDFTLTEPTTATLKVKSFSFPRSQPFLQSGIEGDFFLGRLIGMDTQTKSTISLNSIEGHVSSKNIADNIDFSMHAKGHNEQGNAAAWNMLGSLTKGFNLDGSINKQDLSMTLDATIDSLPIPLLCQFICFDPKLKQKIEAVFGPILDAKIKAQLQRMNGPVFIDVKGKNGHLTLDAIVNEGILILNNDMKAQLTVTPELGEHVLEDLIPVMSGILSADHPISLTINKNGFAFPLRDVSILSIAIGNATLDMGKVRFSSQSQIAKVLNLLTTASSDQMVWLTPAYFSLNQGFLKLERVDMLVSERYPIAAWGNVDFGRDRVDMIIGLSGSAIAKAFSVPGVSNSYFLQLPLKGRLNNPSIDKTKAIARISALVAQSQGGPQGLVLGTVLDIATGGLTEPPIPKPTANPIPWADMMKDSTASASSADSKADPNGKVKTNPVEDIGKEASSILKKIFR